MPSHPTRISSLMRPTCRPRGRLRPPHRKRSLCSLICSARGGRSIRGAGTIQVPARADIRPCAITTVSARLRPDSNLASAKSRISSAPNVSTSDFLRSTSARWKLICGVHTHSESMPSAPTTPAVLSPPISMAKVGRMTSSPTARPRRGLGSRSPSSARDQATAHMDGSFSPNPCQP